jgi:hypothetical protein
MNTGWSGGGGVATAMTVLSAVTDRSAVTGSRVRVSDASPRGFLAWVIAVHPGALTVARQDNGAWELVQLSRRRVLAVELPEAQLPPT